MRGGKENPHLGLNHNRNRIEQVMFQTVARQRTKQRERERDVMHTARAIKREQKNGAN